jgi:hypothetical protein
MGIASKPTVVVRGAVAASKRHTVPAGPGHPKTVAQNDEIARKAIAAVLLGPVLPFVMAGVFMNVVAVLKYAGPPAFLVVVAVGMALQISRFGRASSDPYFGTETRPALSQKLTNQLALFCLPAGAASHSFSFDHRRRPETLRTAIAIAFFWPTSTTSRFPRVTPV